MSGDGSIVRVRALLAQGKAADALAEADRLLGADPASHEALEAKAAALDALGRREEALEVRRRATELHPRSGVAWHNLAAACGNLGRAAEAEAAARQAFALGLDAPETWVVLGRALQTAGDFDGAEGAYREALKRRPAMADAAHELAWLLWTRDGDAAAADAPLQAALAAGGERLPLVLARGKLLEAAGRRAEMHGLYASALAANRDDVGLLLAASQACLEEGEVARGAGLAERADRALPGDPYVQIMLAAAYLAQGRTEEARARAEAAVAAAPEDQAAWGWLATTLRTLGDPGYGALADYDALVRAYDLATPPGWADLGAYLADLGAALRKLHGRALPPPGQSMRHGTQTFHDLQGSNDPAVKAFFRALDAPIRAYLAAVGGGEGPLRSRNAGRYRIQGAWSVLLKPGGFHVDHFHPSGWISTAFYVETPALVRTTRTHEGWLRFGQPPYQTIPPLPADHCVQPQPGRLVLFPSYMWHGTVPFAGEEQRMTIAFDVVPG